MPNDEIGPSMRRLANFRVARHSTAIRKQLFLAINKLLRTTGEQSPAPPDVKNRRASANLPRKRHARRLSGHH
jgi:hypothetical protein